MITPVSKTRKQLMAMYRALFRAYGPQHWWPGDTPFEVVVGAILTQNTAWINVEQAIKNLKRERLLSPARLREVAPRRLALLIRPSGYFNIKANRLAHLMDFLAGRYKGSLARMLRDDPGELRKGLLSVNGIGPETADSIMLYAAGRPVFVVDAYTRRILDRHRVPPLNAPYDEIRHTFEHALRQASNPRRMGRSPRHPVSRMSASKVSPVARRYIQMHALLVMQAKSLLTDASPS
jgi:endonuclease-3 related protein